SAQYRVMLVLEWSSSTHPATLPPGWHTSPAVLAVHEGAGDLVPIGGDASPGVESMAETGKTAILLEELTANAAVAAVEVGMRVDGAGADELEIGATQGTPLLSLVTMLAPSPDWFVGVVDVSLFDGDQWVEQVELDLIAWDAGTDSGPEFTSDDADTQPRDLISGPRDPGYIDAAAEARFGHIVIERIG
ncbi:MAG: spondin domain-containing protein, partial [Acidimicrobiales bacterium]